MTLTHKIWNFPTIQIAKQLFYVPGAMSEGGFTSGGARMSSAEPGGFGMLQVEPALRTAEFVFPVASWLMSKTNGEILRFRLAPTPQVCQGQQMRSQSSPWENDEPWNNDEEWSGDMTAQYTSVALRGSNVLTVDTSVVGAVLQAGHVIGHGNVTYLIDEISYSGSIATLVVRPPLRANVAVGDLALFRPYFIGSIMNANNALMTYDADLNGMIQIPKLTLTEVVLP